MKRRSFVKQTIIGGAVATALPTISKAITMNTAAAMNDFYELRVYTLKNETQQKLVEDYLQKAYIPAVKSHGIDHVGVFTELKPDGQTKIFVLTQYSTLDKIDSLQTVLDGDKTYQNLGAAYLNAPASAPAYERIESSLMKAFKNMPHLVAPAKTSRIFELRQYQSASEAAGKKKIEMFNDQGEIDIFKRLGFKPVFWGETVIGPLRPNLTYMITFDDLAAKDAHWKAFVADPQWKKISSVPEYADALLVSKITSTLLVPTAYSQV
ncbi:NIPSNAP family protein [Mucilaginibacter dorajii]|uniref:NIPSNAP domain-containing protein n=1 Tax=Mucilaginibacter dorajii TaxID=692994 RepID=A0ABP7PPZ3_9SPHI|nr:NIPSNAP family protein [Mucilaginibacter dorajii]MCS3736914.1 hypothetical protein [Mucilaginibacter dorajii]